MGHSAIGSDRRYWTAATWSVAGWFVVNTLVLLIAGRLIDSEATEIPLGAFVIAAAVSAGYAAVLRWWGSGSVRAVATAAVVAASAWSAATVLIALLYFSAK